MSNVILEIKPKFFGCTLNVNALWRRLSQKPKLGGVALVSDRFLKVFADHGVSVSQIPQFLPQITLDKLQSTDSLLSVLSSDVLAQTAELFQIRHAWLEGIDDQLYSFRACYKDPARFFEDLANIRTDSDSFPARALYTGPPLDATNGREQPVVLCLMERIKSFGDQDIYRYFVYQDAWDWGHPVCRIQLKAMARVLDTVLNIPLPLYRVAPAILGNIREGKRVPQECMKGTLLTSPSLEDYALSRAESVHAKECEELPTVLNYIDKIHLKTLRKAL